MKKNNNLSQVSSLNVTIDRLYYNDVGQIIVSALFGLSLALIFRRVCNDNCVLYYAPDMNNVENKVFNLENTCYKYTPYAVKCENKEYILPYDVNKKPDNLIEEKGYLSKFF
jgi:hypothetical protein